MAGTRERRLLGCTAPFRFLPVVDRMVRAQLASAFPLVTRPACRSAQGRPGPRGSVLGEQMIVDPGADPIQCVFPERRNEVHEPVDGSGVEVDLGLIAGRAP